MHIILFKICMIGKLFFQIVSSCYNEKVTAMDFILNILKLMAYFSLLCHSHNRKLQLNND